MADGTYERRGPREAELARLKNILAEQAKNREILGVNAGDYDSALVGREFEHFKGKRYQLLAFANDSETLETMVVYRLLYGNGGVWVRRAKMFFETVEHDGKIIPRFRLVEK